MHVVFILANHSSAPYFNWFAEYSSGDSDLKFSFINLCSTRPIMIDEVGRWGCDCHWIPYNNMYRKSEIPIATLKLYRLLKKIRPDIVHSHLFDDSLMGMIASKFAGIKMRVITKGDTGFHYNNTPIWVKMDKLNNANSTHIIAISEENKQFILQKEKANPKKVSRIHHGIPYKIATSQNLDLITFYRKKFGLENKIVIGSVSRLIEWKGYKNIINTAKITINKYPNCKFVFVGTGPQENELKQIVKNLKLEDFIIFTGFIPSDHIPSLYGLFDIFVHAAKEEPFGLVIAEAMLNKLPIVSTNTGAAKDAITTKENGYTIEYENLDNLHEGIFFMMENNRKRIGEAAFKTAMEKYEFQIMYDNHKKLYSSK